MVGVGGNLLRKGVYVVMNNLFQVLTDRNYFIDKFPEKRLLVKKYSMIELLLLFWNMREDLNKGYLISKNKSILFKKAIKDWLGEPIINDTVYGIINGSFNADRMYTDDDLEIVFSLLKGEHAFINKLWSIHPTEYREFLVENNCSLCGQVLLWEDDTKVLDVLNTIDFEFTTVRNLMTALRFDINVKDVHYGKIRTNNDVFIVSDKSYPMIRYVRASKVMSI